MLLPRLSSGRGGGVVEGDPERFGREQGVGKVCVWGVFGFSAGFGPFRTTRARTVHEVSFEVVSRMLDDTVSSASCQDQQVVG